MAYNNLPSADELRHLFDYDPETGLLTWRHHHNARARAGKQFGSLNSYGYRQGHLRGRQYKTHRLIWIWMTGESPTSDIDHIDGNRQNNRWNNLRKASRSQNLANMRLGSNSTSGFKGVSWSKRMKKWMAHITQSRKTTVIGFFDHPEDAHNAYRLEAVRRFGEFARFE